MDALDKIQKLIKELNVSYERAKNALESCNYDYSSAKQKLERENRQGGEGGNFPLIAIGLLKTLISVRRGEKRYFSVPIVIVLILLLWKPIVMILLFAVVRPLLKLKLNAVGPLERQVNKPLSKIQDYIDNFFERF